MGSALDRPAVLTAEIQKQIIEALAHGSYVRVACEAAGITYRGFRWWQARWEQGDEDAQKFADFFHAVKAASAVAEVSALRDVKGGRPGWQGPAWFLERRFPKRWGRQDRTPVAPPPKPPKPLDEMSDEEFDRYKGEVEGAG